MDTLVGVPAPGSCPVLSTMTADFESDVRRGIAADGVTPVARSQAEVGTPFEGARLPEPGIVPVAESPPEEAPDGPVSLCGGVAVRP
ncbi:SAM-dependent methyltransferase [Streptomyces sp. NPDC004457]